jgi:hypothetical protein
MPGTSSARIGAMRVRWNRPNAKYAPLTPIQIVSAVTYGLFVAFLAAAILELVGFQMLVCGGTPDGCAGVGDAHGAYLGIVVVPTALIAGISVWRWNVGRLRSANADAEWVKKQAGTK